MDNATAIVSIFSVCYTKYLLEFYRHITLYNIVWIKVCSEIIILSLLLQRNYRQVKKNIKRSLL